jgi:hypothetical protein
MSVTTSLISKAQENFIFGLSKKVLLWYRICPLGIGIQVPINGKLSEKEKESAPLMKIVSRSLRALFSQNCDSSLKIRL